MPLCQVRGHILVSCGVLLYLPCDARVSFSPTPIKEKYTKIQWNRRRIGHTDINIHNHHHLHRAIGVHWAFSFSLPPNSAASPFSSRAATSLLFPFHLHQLQVHPLPNLTLPTVPYLSISSPTVIFLTLQAWKWHNSQLNHELLPTNQFIGSLDKPIHSVFIAGK